MGHGSAETIGSSVDFTRIKDGEIEFLHQGRKIIGKIIERRVDPINPKRTLGLKVKSKDGTVVRDMTKLDVVSILPTTRLESR